MKYKELTIKASEIARSIILPVIASQSEIRCHQFGIEKIEADVCALIDTGATNTSISNKLAASLNLKAVEQCKVAAAGGIHIANVYSIEISIKDMLKFTNIKAAEFIKNDKFDIIIGMDILTLGDLAITNHDHRTVVSFRVPPDTVHIDFTTAANNNNEHS